MACKQALTKELIRKSFGSDAKIRQFGNRFNVKTRSGGEVIVSPKKITLVLGGEETYRSIALLSGEMWDRVQIKGGQEYMLGAMAHSEALNIPAVPNYRKTGEGFVRGLFVFLIVAAGFGLVMAGASPWVLLWAIVIAILFGHMSTRASKREQQKKIEQFGYHYPRTDGRAGDARRDDLDNKDWL